MLKKICMQTFIVLFIIASNWKQIKNTISRWTSNYNISVHWSRGFLGVSAVKNPPGNAGDAGDTGLIPASGRLPGEGNGNPLQYSCWKSHGEKSLVGYSPWGPQELDWISKWACMRTLGHYSAIKMSDLLIYTATWMNPQNILNKRSQTRKSAYCMTAFIWTSVGVKTNTELREVDGDCLREAGEGIHPAA